MRTLCPPTPPPAGGWWSPARRPSSSRSPPCCACSPAARSPMRALDDIGQSVAAVLGAAGCFWRMRRCRAAVACSWALIGAALACWAAGELVWSYYELIARRETPFPSLADVGYLLFPALALPGLLVRPSAALEGRGKFRVVLDGAMVAASLFNLSWATSLGTVYHGGGQDSLRVRREPGLPGQRPGHADGRDQRAGARPAAPRPPAAGARAGRHGPGRQRLLLPHRARRVPHRLGRRRRLVRGLPPDRRVGRGVRASRTRW